MKRSCELTDQEWSQIADLFPKENTAKSAFLSSVSQYLLGLINDVLDMNKIESGSATLKPLTFSHPT